MGKTLLLVLQLTFVPNLLTEQLAKVFLFFEGKSLFSLKDLFVFMGTSGWRRLESILLSVLRNHSQALGNEGPRARGLFLSVQMVVRTGMVSPAARRDMLVWTVLMPGDHFPARRSVPVGRAAVRRILSDFRRAPRG